MNKSMNIEGRGAGYGLLLGLLLGVGLVPGVARSQGLVEVMGVKSDASLTYALGEKYPSEQFRMEVRFGLVPEPSEGISDAPTTEKVTPPGEYNPLTDDLLISFLGGTDPGGAARGSLLVKLPAGSLVATGKGGDFTSPTTDPLGSLVSVVYVGGDGGELKVNPGLARLAVKVQARPAANVYAAVLEWTGKVQPPTQYPVTPNNPALSAARVRLEVTGKVTPPDGYVGEAVPVSFEGLYRGEQ
jgi:hypothetical protein